MNLVVFEDAGAERLFPITTGRPCYTITCASLRLVDWLLTLKMPSCGVVRDYLVDVQAADYPQLRSEVTPNQPWTLVVNARVTPSISNFEAIRSLLKDFERSNQSCGMIVRNGWAVAAAVVPTSRLIGKRAAVLLEELENYCNGATEQVHMVDIGTQLFDYPHDVVRENLQQFPVSLRYRIAEGDYSEVQPGVFCSGQQSISDYVVFDTSAGPIVIEEDVSIGPFTLIEGPVHIDRNCRIIEHAAIKDSVCLGHTTKIGGEVEASVIEPYTNKQHHGFLGHSYLGRWINLGAGTCNSDLKNTYGKVNMEYGGQRVATDMRFVGCIIGDYAKTAINTSIFTGKTIGACSMVYGFVTTNVPSFVNYARSFGQTTELPAEVMQSTQQRMFARRNVEQRDCDLKLLVDMHRVTADERQLSGDPLVL